MKIISTILAGVCLLSLTACIKIHPKTWGGESLKDKQGSLSGAEAESLLAYEVDEKI